MSNPVLVNTIRGEIIENRHRGAIAVCDPSGRILHAWGDVETLVYPRSAIKPLQALPLVETGAADYFGLSAAELALACSSHSAEPLHVDTIQRWLTRLELDETALECGPHAPADSQAALALILDQTAAGRIHNNCSGKHTGMLTTARFMGEEISGYIDREHPAQKRWLNALGEIANLDMYRLPWSFDGCGIPVVAMPLAAIATAFARMTAPDDLPATRGAAINRICEAIAANPIMIAGNQRLTTKIMMLTGRRVLVKSGADGVYIAMIPDKNLGVALKIDDGTGEAAEVAMLAVLTKLDSLLASELETLADRCRMPITNTRGILTGYREAAAL